MTYNLKFDLEPLEAKETEEFKLSKRTLTAIKTIGKYKISVYQWDEVWFTVKEKFLGIF